MKKIFLSIFFALISFSCNAQIYSIVKYLDKFDDIIKVEQRKTLITKTDSTFVIEEKGKQPVVYYILNIVPAATKGSQDDVVNLVENVYGYEEAWCVVRSDMYEKYTEAYNKYLFDDTEKNLQDVIPFWIFIVHRTITTQYTATYLDDLFWIEDDFKDGKLGKDINRIIYSKK